VHEEEEEEGAGNCKEALEARGAVHGGHDGMLKVLQRCGVAEEHEKYR